MHPFFNIPHIFLKNTEEVKSYEHYSLKFFIFIKMFRVCAFEITVEKWSKDTQVNVIKWIYMFKEDPNLIKSAL